MDTSRSIALINAALDFYQALAKIQRYASSLSIQVESGYPPKAALEQLTDYVSKSNYSLLFNDFAASSTVLAMEHEHFARNAKRNAQEADRQRHRRALEGKPKRKYIKRVTYLNDETLQTPESMSPGESPVFSPTSFTEDQMIMSFELWADRGEIAPGECMRCEYSGADEECFWASIMESQGWKCPSNRRVTSTYFEKQTPDEELFKSDASE